MTAPTAPKIFDRIQALEKSLRRISGQFSSDMFEADDIYQTIVEKLLKSDPAISNSKLLTLAKWTAIDHTRAKVRYTKKVACEHEIAAGNDDDDTSGLVWEMYDGHQPSVEKLVEERETLALIQAAAAKLSPENREIIKLICLGESPAAISRRLGVSKSAISQRIAGMTTFFALNPVFA